MTNQSDSGHQEITHREITAVVKWFNPTKGFGFVQPSDGSPDAFMHISVVEQSGHRHLPEGATIICDLAAGQKGPQVTIVHSVEDIPEPTMPDDAETIVVEGSVKFYNREKGFGFVTPDDGGKDVFISARVLLHTGLQSLEAAQRVRMVTHMGPKGPMADSIEAI
jgi:CspA family cold shock protein